MTKDKEIELSLEDGAMEKEGWAIAYGLLRCAQAIQNCAFQLKQLGIGDAATSMGAMEAHGVMIKDAGESIASAIASVSDSIDNHK